MPNYSNETGLPKSIAKALSTKRYTKVGDWSVTELIKPPKIVQLERRHDHEITVDVADRIFAVMGQIGHKIFEESEHKDAIKEERLSLTVLGKTVTGQIDMYEDRGIYDIKWTSLYAAKGKPKPDWIAQLNIYAFMFRTYGFPVEFARICALFRDWSKTQAIPGRKKHDYPRYQSKVINIPLWSDEHCQEFLEERVALHEKMKDVVDDKIPSCNAEERWDRPFVYAILKKGGKKSLKNFYGKNKGQEAKNHLTNLKAKYEADPKKKKDAAGLHIEERPGERPRCEIYCDCNQFCNSYKTYMKEKAA